MPGSGGCPERSHRPRWSEDGGVLSGGRQGSCHLLSSPTELEGSRETIISPMPCLGTLGLPNLGCRWARIPFVMEMKSAAWRRDTSSGRCPTSAPRDHTFTSASQAGPIPSQSAARHCYWAAISTMRYEKHFLSEAISHLLALFFPYSVLH